MCPVAIATAVHTAYKPEVKFPRQRIFLETNGSLQNALDVFSQPGVSDGHISGMSGRRK
jgi:hypothetical protein